MTKNTRNKERRYSSMAEFKKSVYPNTYNEEKKKEKKASDEEVGSILAQNFLNSIKKELSQ